MYKYGDKRVVKSLLIDKYSEKVLFSYPIQWSNSVLVCVSSITLSDVIEHVHTMDITNHFDKSVLKKVFSTFLFRKR